MADRTVHPTPAWRWPEGDVWDVFMRMVVDLYAALRDRDELAAALERRIAACECPYETATREQIYCDACEPDRALLARIKAGGR